MLSIKVNFSLFFLTLMPATAAEGTATRALTCHLGYSTTLMVPAPPSLTIVGSNPLIALRLSVKHDT